MRRTIQITFIALLTLLQIAAPLVHAHAGYSTPSSGVHLPGLEWYGHRQTDHPSFSSGAYQASDGVLVDIGTGLEKPRPQRKARSKPADAVTLVTTLTLWTALSTQAACVHPPPLVTRFTLHSLSAATPVRAPPL